VCDKGSTPLLGGDGYADPIMDCTLVSVVFLVLRLGDWSSIYCMSMCFEAALTTQAVGPMTKS